jgi:hypothetical protein
MSEGEVVVQKRRHEVSAKVSAVQLLLCLIRQRWDFCPERTLLAAQGDAALCAPWAGELRVSSG